MNNKVRAVVFWGLVITSVAFPFCKERPFSLKISTESSTPVRQLNESDTSWNNRLTYWFLNGIGIEPEAHNNWLTSIPVVVGTPTVQSWIKYATDGTQTRINTCNANADYFEHQARTTQDPLLRTRATESAKANREEAASLTCSGARNALAMTLRVGGTIITLGAAGQWIYRAVDEGTPAFWQWKDEEQMRYALARQETFRAKEAKKNIEEFTALLGKRLDELHDQFNSHQNSFEQQLCAKMGDENGPAARRAKPFDEHNQDVDQLFLRLENKKWFTEKIVLTLVKQLPEGKDFHDEKGRPLPAAKIFKVLIRLKDTDLARKEYFTKVAKSLLGSAFSTILNSAGDVDRFFSDALVRVISQEFSEIVDKIDAR